MVRRGSSMLKYTQAPGAVVSSCGSSDTGSVGRTMVSVPPRFCASAGATGVRTIVAARAAASVEQIAVPTRVMGGSPLGSRLQQLHEGIEVLPVHLPAAVFQVADDSGEPARERHGDAERLALAREHAELAVDFRLALPHGEVTPDAGLRLGVRPVVNGDGAHGTVTSHLVSPEGCPVPDGIELVEGLDPHPCLVGHRQSLADAAAEPPLP